MISIKKVMKMMKTSHRKMKEEKLKQQQIQKSFSSFPLCAEKQMKKFSWHQFFHTYFIDIPPH